MNHWKIHWKLWEILNLILTIFTRKFFNYLKTIKLWFHWLKNEKFQAKFIVFLIPNILWILKKKKWLLYSTMQHRIKTLIIMVLIWDLARNLWILWKNICYHACDKLFLWKAIFKTKLNQNLSRTKHQDPLDGLLSIYIE